MYQMLKQFDDFMPQERGELDSAFGATEEYLQNISERLRSRVVIVTMFPHILLTIFLWLWRSSDIVSDRYLTYSIATSVIFIVQIYNLYTSRVSSQFCSKLLSINFLISHTLSLIDSREKEIETLSLTVSNSRFSFLFWIPPFSYVFAGKKFGIAIAIITCTIYFYEIVWPAAGGSLIRGIFYLVLDLIIPTLMFTLLSTFTIERLFTNKQTEQAREANRSRSVFLQTISHELRTPIHGILASTEILCSSSLSSAQRALISAIQNSGINVIHMADHILRVAKTEDLNVLKGITHETIPFDLYKATEQIADGMELLFETENIHFDFEYKIPLKQSMYIGDVGVIKQIIINLLGTVLSLGQLETVTFCVENHFKEKTDTENIFTIKLIIVTKQKSEDYGESSESNSQRSPSVERLSELNMEFRFVQTLVGTFNGSFEFGDSLDFTTPFVIKLDLPIADDDTNPTNNTIPIPLRYLSKKIEDADPRILLKIGIIRTDNSLITRKIISFLQEFKMKFNIITPNDIPLCDINILIFDSAEADNEMIETICRNVRNTRILIISITLLLKHLIICETAQKVGLEDNDIYFVAKPLTIVKFWNSLISAAEAIKKRSYIIESITGSVQGEICETISRQGETNEESREHSNPHQSETSEESREHSNPHQGETSEESREDSIPHQGETSEESREDSIPHQDFSGPSLWTNHHNY